MGHVGSKSRSLGQILETPCVRSRGHMFSLIIIKLGQNVYLGEIAKDFENWSGRVKNYVTRSNLRKNIVYALEVTFSVQQSLVRMFVMMKS